jgi:hypothetical protein
MFVLMAGSAVLVLPVRRLPGPAAVLHPRDRDDRAERLTTERRRDHADAATPHRRARLAIAVAVLAPAGALA